MPLNLLQMLKVMVDQDGADLFLSVGSRPTIRGGKGIYTIDDHLVTDEDALGYATEVMNDHQKQVFFETNEMNMAFEREGVGRFPRQPFPAEGACGSGFTASENHCPHSG